jgi:hypothetical protein
MSDRKVPLRVGIKPEDGQIVEVGECRHKVIWAGQDEPSDIDYCNNCGSAFVFGPDGGPDFCACGAPAD